MIQQLRSEVSAIGSKRRTQPSLGTRTHLFGSRSALIHKTVIGARLVSLDEHGGEVVLLPGAVRMSYNGVVKRLDDFLRR
jgi:hypothetical protein